MTPGIAITLIICGTILILSIISTLTKIASQKKSREIIDQSVDKLTKKFETPENNDYFKKF